MYEALFYFIIVHLKLSIIFEIIFETPYVFEIMYIWNSILFYNGTQYYFWNHFRNTIWFWKNIILLWNWRRICRKTKDETKTWLQTKRGIGNLSREWITHIIAGIESGSIFGCLVVGTNSVFLIDFGIGSLLVLSFCCARACNILILM